jgi:hypothetical protein
MVEGDPGTRRYKWFRPRQAYRGGAPVTNPGGGKFATISLYNASTGPLVLVVRDLNWGSTSGAAASLGYKQGRLSGTAGVVTPLFPGDHAGAGLVDFQAAAAVLVGEYAYESPALTQGAWPHDFPLAIVPPGWAFFVCNQSAASPMGAGLIWEEVSIDELEFMYDF